MRRLLWIACLAAVPALHAQGAGTRPLQLVVSGGLQLPTGSFADYHDYGVHADVGVSLRVGGFRLRPELSYARFNVKERFTVPGILRNGNAGAGGGSGGGPYDDALSSLLAGFANIELPLGRGPIQPFVLAGVGAVSLSSELTPDALSTSDINASLNLGAGLRFRLGPIAGLIEGRLNNVPTGDTRAFFRDVRTIPVTFGLVF